LYCWKNQINLAENGFVDVGDLKGGFYILQIILLDNKSVIEKVFIEN
jgi:hypothetical protein